VDKPKAYGTQYSSLTTSTLHVLQRTGFYRSSAINVKPFTTLSGIR